MTSQPELTPAAQQERERRRADENRRLLTRAILRLAVLALVLLFIGWLVFSNPMSDVRNPLHGVLPLGYSPLGETKPL